MKFVQMLATRVNSMPPPNLQRKAPMAGGAMIASTVTTLLQTTSAKAATRNQTAPPEKPKPSSTLSATLSRFLAATLFALLFIVQPSNVQGVDASQPTIAFTNPSQLVNDAAFTLTGTVTTDATVNVLAGGSSMAATVTDTDWSLDVTLIEGNNVFTATNRNR